MLEKLNDKILLYRLQTKHDPGAYAQLYDTYVKQIYRFVYFKVSSHEEAEDITSEVFLKAWRFLQEKKEINSFSGLLYRIARNAVIDLYRARASKPESPINEDTDVGDSGKWYADVSNKVDTERIVTAIKKLKQEYQEIITLRYVDELEIAEIAEIVGKNNLAIRVTLHRAVGKLKKILAEKTL